MLEASSAGICSNKNLVISGDLAKNSLFCFAYNKKTKKINYLLSIKFKFLSGKGGSHLRPPHHSLFPIPPEFPLFIYGLNPGHCARSMTI